MNLSIFLTRYFRSDLPLGSNIVTMIRKETYFFSHGPHHARVHLLHSFFLNSTTSERNEIK